MPTYEYVCTACTHRFELVQKFSDDPITECPECSGKVRKVYFAAGVVFKGSGWYINDSRPSAPSETSSPPTAAVTPAPATETKSDTGDAAIAPSAAPASPAPATTGTGTTSSSSPVSA